MILCNRRYVLCVCVRGEESRGEKHKIDKREKMKYSRRRLYINKANINYKNVALQGRSIKAI